MWIKFSAKKIPQPFEAPDIFSQQSKRTFNPYPTAFRTGTVWFYTSTSNKRAARPKLYTESLTRDLKFMYSRLTLVRIYIKL